MVCLSRVFNSSLLNVIDRKLSWLWPKNLSSVFFFFFLFSFVWVSVHSSIDFEELLLWYVYLPGRMGIILLLILISLFSRNPQGCLPFSSHTYTLWLTGIVQLVCTKQYKYSRITIYRTCFDGMTDEGFSCVERYSSLFA